MKHAPIDDATRNRLEQVGMGNAPEVVREVGVHHFPMAAKHQLLHLDHRLPLAERCERSAEVVLRLRPVERNPLARPFLRRRATGRHRLLEPRRPALPLAEPPERKAEIVLRLRLPGGPAARVKQAGRHARACAVSLDWYRRSTRMLKVQGWAHVATWMLGDAHDG